MKSQIADRDYLIAVVAIAVGIVLVCFGANISVHGLKKMNEHMEIVQHGQMGQDIPVSGFKEFRALTENYNRSIKKLMEIDTSRQEFVSNVSHELKTPLQSITGSAELLENGLVKPEDVPRFVSLIRTEAARLVTLVDDIIHLSQLDEGVALTREDVDIYEVAMEAVSALQSSAEAKNVQIEATGESIRINGVRGFLHEMFYNLCDNAIKYNIEGGRIEVAVFNSDKGPVVSVKDTGIGIPSEYQSRIFERFFRVDKSRSKASGGTGLGLSIVKHIAQYHHASISLNSQVGMGTAISICFLSE